MAVYKASKRDISEYGTKWGCSLYGHGIIKDEDGNKHKAIIEKLPGKGGEHGDPKYEIIAPDGYRFSDGCHALLEWNIKDVNEQCRHNELVKCMPGDECGCEHADAEAH